MHKITGNCEECGNVLHEEVENGIWSIASICQKCGKIQLIKR